MATDNGGSEQFLATSFFFIAGMPNHDEDRHQADKNATDHADSPRC
jgi:hypothetical protein